VTETVEIVVDGLAFAEGLRWHHDALWYADMHAGEIHSWSTGSGDTVVAEIPGPVSGLGWAPNGDLLAVSMDDRRLLQVDLKGPPATVADLSAHTPHPINDMTVDATGRAYIGTFGFDFHAGADFQTGLVLQVDPDGGHRIAADDLWFPNGMVLTDLGRTLVVAETYGGRLTAFARNDDGSLADRRVWAQLPAGVLPDGICLDADGAIWIASTTTSECLRIVEGGDVVDRVTVGERMAVACTLGGDDGRTLFIATSEHLAPEDTRRHRSSRIEATTVEIEGP
jgi:sugar lactone lactonase YvrE